MEAKKNVERRLVDDWVSMSLHRTLWEGVDTRAESLARFRYLGLEICALLARLYLTNFVFSLLTSFCLQSRFFGKFQPDFLCWEKETMFFCSCLNQRVRTALSLSGVEERLGWVDRCHAMGGVTVDVKARDTWEGDPVHTHSSVLSSSMYCGKGEVRERGLMPFT